MVLEGDVSVTTAGAGLWEGEAQPPDEARRQAAGLDELEEDPDGRAHVPVLHESRWVQLGQAAEVRFGELLGEGDMVTVLILGFIREGIIP